MSAAHKPAMLTAAQLKEDLERYEKKLADALRLQGSTRAALSMSLAENDSSAAAIHRKELIAVATRIQELRETTEALCSAIQRSETGARQVKNNKARAEIERRINAVRDLIVAHDENVAACGRGYTAALQALERVVAACTENGVSVTGLSSLSLEFPVMHKWALYCASDGKLGGPRGPQSITEMRASFSLTSTAREWCDYNLRRLGEELGAEKQ